MKQYRFSIAYSGKFSHSWGYAMYGAFLDQLRKEDAISIHKDKFYNQYITPTEWIVNTELEYDFKDSYFLQKFNTEVRLYDKKIVEWSEQEMADKYLVKEPHNRIIRFYFHTPTTFKQDGEYVLYPTKRLIMQSLTNKWNNWAKEFLLEDIKWDNCKISRYALKSTAFSLKGVKILGFTGYVDLYFWGSESLIRLGNMVCKFADYSGVGIKTTLGMGGVRVG